MEDRRHVRFKIVAPVTLSWTSPEKRGCEGTGFTSDVSGGGMFVASEQRLPVGAKVHFDLCVAPSLTLDGQGVVVRSRECDGKLGYGIEASRMDVKKRNGAESHAGVVTSGNRYNF